MLLREGTFLVPSLLISAGRLMTMLLKKLNDGNGESDVESLSVRNEQGQILKFTDLDTRSIVDILAQFPS
jgi:hypothetical protein